MARIVGETHIARPPEVVFDVVADERNRYDPSIRHAELLTDGPIGVGTRFRSVAGGGRGAVEMIVEITLYDRPRRLATRTRSAAVDIDSALGFEPAGPGTLLRWSTHLSPRGPARLLSPLLPIIGRRQMRRVWAALEAYFDRQPEPMIHDRPQE